MTGLRIETFHIDEENIPSHLRPVVEAAATTSWNEFPHGGIVVATLGEIPVATLTIGESAQNPRVGEIRKVQQLEGDASVAVEGLRKAWHAVKIRTKLFYDGLYVDESVTALIPQEVIASAGIATTGFNDVSGRDVERLVRDSR